ncbi:hypothetical protein Athai_12950 [Actinocatenispora thailandica]|uniref:Uncharacterized protein n=1 Tax=Actinocatenispora thailandica TaxID=227318 RepID=A0A7R7DLH7_9ACTN|nr:hypothetical protein [Actinocatenispora thailandica]BCJ33792.1 hypothetical protein Athai_12950 [Actinocatenispora thailandica]
MGRIGNQFEDRLRRSGDLAADADHTRNLITTEHPSIEAHGGAPSELRTTPARLLTQLAELYAEHTDVVHPFDPDRAPP